jgi:hypothetical protein
MIFGTYLSLNVKPNYGFACGKIELVMVKFMKMPMFFISNQNGEKRQFKVSHGKLCIDMSLL